MRWMLVVMLMPIAACVHGGAERISDGVYVVNARGNAFVGQGDVMAEAYRQANDVCPEGFEVGDSAMGKSSAWVQTSQYTVQRLDKPEVTLVVRCTTPEPAPRAPRRAAIEAEPDAATWWCTHAVGYLTGHCDRDRGNCDRMRERLASANNVEMPRCYRRSVVYCFRVQMPDGLSMEMCSPESEMCQFDYDHSQAAPMSECAALR